MTRSTKERDIGSSAGDRRTRAVVPGHLLVTIRKSCGPIRVCPGRRGTTRPQPHDFRIRTSAEREAAHIVSKCCQRPGAPSVTLSRSEIDPVSSASAESVHILPADYGDCSAPAAVPTWRTELPDLVEVVAVSRQWRRSSRPSAVHSWVAPRSLARPRREVLSQSPKLTASPSGQADPGAAYYRVIRTRVPSGIPDSRCNAAAGTRTQPLLTAWPNTDRLGQPCRPTVPGPPPKVESALE